MRVLSIYSREKRGGFTKRLYRLFEALAANGHGLVYLSTDRTPPVSAKIDHRRIRAPFGQSENIIFWICFSLLSFIQTLALARKHRIERIVVFSPFYAFLSLLPICLLNIPAVTFIRADNMKHSSNRLRNSIFYLLDRIGIRCSARLVFAGTSLARTYGQRFAVRDKTVQILPNSVDRKFVIDPASKQHLRLRLGIGPEDFLLSTSGNINRGKNFGFLIEAMHQLQLEKARLLIIGDESQAAGELQRLKKMIFEWRLSERVLFCGWQPNPLEYIAASDLFVFPSKYEGSPNALLEALGCGIPCLGSEIDEIREILHYGELLFSLDRPDGLVEIIKNAYEDVNYYKRLLYLSEMRCEHFTDDWDKKAVEMVTG